MYGDTQSRRARLGHCSIELEGKVEICIAEQIAAAHDNDVRLAKRLTPAQSQVVAQLAPKQGLNQISRKACGL